MIRSNLKSWFSIKDHPPLLTGIAIVIKLKHSGEEKIVRGNGELFIEDFNSVPYTKDDIDCWRFVNIDDYQENYNK